MIISTFSKALMKIYLPDIIPIIIPAINVSIKAIDAEIIAA